MNCIECGKIIPKARLKVLPDTETCVKCSQAQPVLGVTVWDHCSSELIAVNSEQAKRFAALDKSEGRLSRLK